jgi:hypothetical protein
VPCCDSATAASLVILALGVAALTTKISGLPARSHRSTVAPTGWDDDQLGHRDDRLDRHRDRRRSIDHRQAEALLAQDRKVAGQARDGRLGESGELVLAFVPPVGQRTLGVDVDQHDRSETGSLSLNGEVPGQGRLARSALLRCQSQNAQCKSPTCKLQKQWSWRSQIVPNFRLRLVGPIAACAQGEARRSQTFC